MFVHGTRHTPANLPPSQADSQAKAGRGTRISVQASASPIHSASRQDARGGLVPIPRSHQPAPSTMLEEGAAMLEKNGKALQDQDGYKAFVRANNFFFARGCELEKKGRFENAGGTNLYAAHLPGASRVMNTAPRLRRNRAEYAKEKINAFSAAIRSLDPRRRRTDPLATPANKTAIHGGIAAVRQAKLITSGVATSGGDAALHGAVGALNVASAVTSGIYAALSTSDAIDVCASKREAERIAFANHVGARECMACLLRGETPSEAQSAAYCTFMAASRRLGVLNQHVRKLEDRAQLALLRDDAGYMSQAIVTNTKQIGATAGTIVGTGAYVLASVSGFLSVFTGALYVADGASVAAQQTGRMRELKAARQAPTAATDSADVLQALAKPFDDNIERLHRQAKRERGFAISRIVKGSMESVMGAVGAGCGIALVVGVGVGTAGIALALAGVALSVCFIASCAVKTGYAWKSEHTSKQRQRFAEQIAATTDRKELAHIFESAYLSGVDRKERTMRVVHTGDRQTGVQDKVIRLKKMDILSNEYLALDVVAGFVLDQSRAGPVGKPQPATSATLATDVDPDGSATPPPGYRSVATTAPTPVPLGSVVRQPFAAEALSEIEFTQIINVLRQRRDAAAKAWKTHTPKDALSERQFFLDHEKADLWFIKASIAPSLGLKLRSIGGKPEAVPAAVYRDAFEACHEGALAQAQRAARKKGATTATGPSEPRIPEAVVFELTAKALFSTVSRAEFLAAAERVKARVDQLEIGKWESLAAMDRFILWLSAPVAGTSGDGSA